MTNITADIHCISNYISPDFDMNKLPNINQSLTNFINHEFDTKPHVISNLSLEEKITEIIIGSQNIRLGSRPEKETLELIHGVVCNKILNNEAIPIVIPAGPYKTILYENIDIAEVCALKTLHSLNENVCKYYKPGLEFYLREEDITGWILSGYTSEVKSHIEKYLVNFEKLIKIFGYNKFIIPFKESSLSSLEDVNFYVQIYSQIIQKYIHASEHINNNDYQKLISYRFLNELGWRGIIPIEQRNFYRDRYAKLYPKKSIEELNELLSTYLGICFAKSKLGALTPKHLGKEFIQLNFAAPIPGIPKDIASKRVYYRTLPINVSKMHLPFWRAKGFLKLNATDISPALIDWGTDLEFYKHTMMLSRGDDSVIISADFLKNVE